jgi:FKBP-type peptidyl-prolyl cis-trans isomerase 2
MIKRKTSLLAVGGLVLVLLLLAVAFSGCLNSDAGASEGDTVFVHYKLTLVDGTYQESDNLPPFVLGQGQLISGFQNAIYGMKIGETKTVTLPPEEAYGNIDPSLVQTFTHEEMMTVLGHIPEVGGTVSTTVGPRQVIEVTDETVVVDFNHHLAGYTLIFEITVVNIVRG